LMQTNVNYVFPYTTLFRSAGRARIAAKDMTMMFARRAAVARIGPTIVFVASLAACQSTPPQPHPGLAFVEASCGGCHSVERHGRSEEHTSELQSRENLVCR